MTDIPSGYKQTEVGVIPEDWREIPLGQLVSSVAYGSSAKSNAQGNVPVLRMGNLQGGKVDWNDLVFTDDEREIKKYSLSPGDVLFNRTNTIDLVGKTALYKGDRPAIFAGYLIQIITDRKLLDPRFLNYVLNAEFSRRHSAKVLSIAVGQANINGQKLKTYPIPLPPTKAEQEAIAEALSDADALIESLEQLIAKKRHVKQGAMQELLTGKKRLPGFQVKLGYKQTEVGVIPEDWDAASLGSLTVLMTNGFVGTVTRHYADNENGVLYIQGYNVEENSFNFHGIKYVTGEFHKAHAKSSLRCGDLLTVQTGDVGLTTMVPDSLAGSNCHALIISRFDKKSVSPGFFSYYLNSSPGRSRLRLIETGTTMKHLNVGDMLEFRVPLPPTEAEQTAITAILSDMDSEIAALETKLTKTRQIKQGMMQELLTGKTRLM